MYNIKFTRHNTSLKKKSVFWFFFHNAISYPIVINDGVVHTYNMLFKCGDIYDL